MLNIRDPIVMVFTQPTGDTTEVEDPVVTSIVIRHPTECTTNETVRIAEEANYSLISKASEDAVHDCECGCLLEGPR